MKRTFSRLINILVIVAMTWTLSSSSCKKVDPPPTQPKDPDHSAKVFLRKEYMDIYYYWYKNVKERNSKIDVSQYDIYDLFDKMLYEKDRWSWMCDKEDYISSETGVVSGTYGASITQPIEYYKDYAVKVRYVFPNSPFDKEGVKRGWTLTHIKGVPVMDLIRGGTFNTEFAKSPQEFTFTDHKGEPHTFNATAANSLSTRSFLRAEVISPESFEGLNEPVGYFHYLSFKRNMLEDIDNAMGTFKAAGIKKLILDLRYNGGGDSNASDLLVNYIAPAKAEGKTYVVRKHNDILASEDKYSKIQRKTGALDLEKLYIITGAGSASASEMVLNGLKPLMDVQTVGDTTYGKPNGMYVLYYPGEKADYDRYNKGDYQFLKYVFLPICFYNQNMNGENIPDDGFIPINYRPDDLYHDFGVEEDLVKACLTHITTGQYPTLPPKTKVSSGGKKIRLAEEEITPKYGVYSVIKQ